MGGMIMICQLVQKRSDLDHTIGSALNKESYLPNTFALRFIDSERLGPMRR